MTVVRNLDNRIKNFSDIQSEVCYDNSFVGEVGYFADSLSEFGNLYTCKKGTLSIIAEEDDDLIFACKNGDDEPLTARDWYEFFIPEKLLRPVKKKYRPFSLNEWIAQHKMGEIISYRSKSTKVVFRHIYTGYAYGMDADINEPNKGTITLGVASYTFSYLFEDYEIEIDGEWVSFGVEVKDSE